MQAVDLRLLGTFAVAVDGVEVPADAWPQRRAADLVKLLAIAPSHRLPRDRVLDAIWPHLDPQPAAAALHKAAHYARRALGSRDAVVLSGGVVALAPTASISSDVAAFEAGGEYPGDLLPDDRYEAWADDERERLRAIALDRLRAAGRWDDLVALDPADEEAHREQMRAAAQAGDRAAVVRSYTRLREELARLGTQPSPASDRLYRDLSRGPAVTAPLGEQSPMQGRGGEIATALGVLDTAATGTGGVLLLCGEAGSGKTRMAELVLAAARERRWHTVRASAAEHPDDVTAAAGDALRADRPDLAAGLPDGAAPAELLARAAGERGCAVLLDDLAVAPDAVADTLRTVAATAARHQLLVIACLQPSEARGALTATADDLVARRVATRIDLEPIAADVRPQTRYATASDGARIAYQAVGDGPVDVVLVPGFVSNVEYTWDMPVARRMFSRVSSFARLILWDKRGTGLSDPVADVPTMDERMRDLTAVLDAAGSDRAVLFGVSEGGPMALAFAAREPARVRALALYNTAPCFLRDAGFPEGWDDETSAQLAARLFERWGTGALVSVFARSRAQDPASREVFGRFQRAGASPSMGRAMVEAMRRMDVRDLLGDVRAPTLVIHRTDDRLIDVAGGRLIAEGVPGAQLVELPGEDHFPFLGDMDPVVEELEAFVSAGQ